MLRLRWDQRSLLLFLWDLAVCPRLRRQTLRDGAAAGPSAAWSRDRGHPYPAPPTGERPGGSESGRFCVFLSHCHTKTICPRSSQSCVMNRASAGWRLRLPPPADSCRGQEAGPPGLHQSASTQSDRATRWFDQRLTPLPLDPTFEYRRLKVG